MVPSVSPSLPFLLSSRLFCLSDLASLLHRHYKLLQIYSLTCHNPRDPLLLSGCINYFKRSTDWSCLEHLFFFANCPGLGALIGHADQVPIPVAINQDTELISLSIAHGMEEVWFLKGSNTRLLKVKIIRALNSHYIFLQA